MSVRLLKGLYCLIATTLLIMSCGGGGGGGDGPVVAPETGPVGGGVTPVDSGGSTTEPVDSGGSTTGPADSGGSTTGPVDSGGSTVDQPALNGIFDLSVNTSAFLGNEFVEVMNEVLGPRVDYLNRVIDLPKDIPVVTDDCGLANAFYVLELSAEELVAAQISEEFNGPVIVMCWELFAETFTFFDNEVDDDVEIALLFSLGAYTHVLYHEVGHAVDQQLSLPIVGNTESAADSIATVLSIEEGNSLAPLTGALLFENSSDGSFGAVHPGGADRAGDLFCWALGGDQSLEEFFPELVQIFANSGRDCASEYAELRDSVISLLPGVAVTTFAKDRAPGALTDSVLESLQTAIKESSTFAKLAAAR